MTFDPAIFYDHMRTGLLGPTLSVAEVAGCDAILTACHGLALAPAAYAFATAYHETAHSMQPIREMGGDAYFRRMYDIMGNRPDVAARLGNTYPGDGVKFSGRGYVQLTGRANYARAGVELGMNGQLIDAPDLAMRPDIAAKIMRRGMEEGWFTGKGFHNFMPDNTEANWGQFLNARRIINGQDRAELIAGYAQQFQEALSESGWA